jgi:DNA polymerase-3 subunit alpha
MITLEDLEGTVQILCMNENYDRYRHLFEPNKTLMVIGEVNNAEDRPKLFPQELLPLEDAPKRFTQQIHFRIPMNTFSAEKLESLVQLVHTHKGNCPIILCFTKPNGRFAFLEPHEKYQVYPGTKIQQAIETLFGKQAYYVKVDKELPERAKPRWEKKRREESD